MSWLINEKRSCLSRTVSEEVNERFQNSDTSSLLILSGFSFAGTEQNHKTLIRIVRNTFFSISYSCETRVAAEGSVRALKPRLRPFFLNSVHRKVCNETTDGRANDASGKKEKMGICFQLIPKLACVSCERGRGESGKEK
jgi:hypothetical protein